MGMPSASSVELVQVGGEQYACMHMHMYTNSHHLSPLLLKAREVTSMFSDTEERLTLGAVWGLHSPTAIRLL